MENSPAITLNSMVRARTHVVWCELDGEAVILNMNTGVYYGLNPVGAMVWQLVQRTIRVAEIADHIIEKYQVDEDRCLSDLRRILSEMSDEKMLEIVA